MVLPGANFSTVLLPGSATYRLPLESKVRSLGLGYTGRVRGAAAQKVTPKERGPYHGRIAAGVDVDVGPAQRNDGTGRRDRCAGVDRQRADAVVARLGRRQIGAQHDRPAAGIDRAPRRHDQIRAGRDVNHVGLGP